MGFMGAGKSRWGKQLASKLNVSFVDLDRAVETKAGMSVTEIFNNLGEAVFRQIETDCLCNVLAQRDVVVSLGGGTPRREENAALLKEKAITIYLKSNAGMLHSRLKNNYKQRPLLADKQPHDLLPFIKKLLTQREPFYNQADVIVPVQGLTIEKLTEALTGFTTTKL